MIDWTSPQDILVRLLIIAAVVAVIWISPFKPRRREYQLLAILAVGVIILMGGLAWR
jgi:low affinity Fe/Cu permease